MANGYGIDVGGVDDIDLSLSIVDSRELLATHLARRLLSLPGSSPFDPEFGGNLRVFLQGSKSNTQIENHVNYHCILDERVSECKSSVTRSKDGDVVTIGITISPYLESGSYDFTLDLSGSNPLIISEGIWSLTQTS